MCKQSISIHTVCTTNRKVSDQCHEWVDSLKSETVVLSQDPAQSCKLIADKSMQSAAVICSPSCAQTYGLVAHKSVANSPYSLTRYYLVSKQPLNVVERHQEPATLLIVSLKNVVSALTRCTACFSHRDINISKIESMPSTRAIQASKPWEYNIVLQVDGAMNETNMQNAVRNLEEFAKVVVLGSFPKFRSSRAVDIGSSPLAVSPVGL